ncbi:hypothetical protein WN944_005830 [Citrus x changshan-huyou]|uniref:Uncharacterized protein n=1 Tax=Citrus x changshan-huyou TaxID=2935761 RepID=A0AAP0MN73_9ROSI
MGGSLFTISMQFVFSLIFFNFTIANFTSSMLSPLCHGYERSALLQFKESLTIIQCNENTGHVIKLDLSNSCLQGFINSSSGLFKLVHLEWLDLAFCEGSSLFK